MNEQGMANLDSQRGSVEKAHKTRSALNKKATVDFEYH
jgi:hypothetical protein